MYILSVGSGGQRERRWKDTKDWTTEISHLQHLMGTVCTSRTFGHSTVHVRVHIRVGRDAKVWLQIFVLHITYILMYALVLHITYILMYALVLYI